MVLGLRSKHRRGNSIKVNYIVHVQEIRPWPPSESLRSVQTVVLQWENSDQYTGTFLSTARDSKIVFNESFRLPLILYQDKKSHDKFQKNHLEFSLFVPRKDKAKGQLLGTAVINLADYGLIDNILNVNTSINFKKSSNNSVQPALVISLEPAEKDSSNTSPNVGLSKEPSLDNDIDGSEIASFTDDDASSHSSRTAGSSAFEVAATSPSQVEKNGYGNVGIDQDQNSNVWPSSTYTSSDGGDHINDNVSSSKFRERSTTSVKKNYGIGTPFLNNSASSISHRDIIGKPNSVVASFMSESVSHDSQEVFANEKYETIEDTQQSSLEGKSFEGFEPEVISAYQYNKKADNSNSANSNAFQEKELKPENVQINDAHVSLVDVEEKRELRESDLNDQIMEEMRNFTEPEPIRKLSDDSTIGNVIMASKKAPEIPLPSSNKTPLNHVKSVQVHGSVEGNGFLSDTSVGGKALNPDVPDDYQKEGELSSEIERKELKGKFSECKNECKTRTEILEEELRETAVTEVGLYSIVAEHGSSGNKVHAPARRLSRFYSNACKEGSQAKRASAARAAISGLVLVSKSCGNDVPRLTFWLSNAIMLRAIVSQIAAELPHKYIDKSDDWEDVSAFIIALEKVESWLFSRIVESVWWQTFTPHMQPTVAKGSDVTSGSGKKKTWGRRNSIGNYEHGDFSTELWKKAFKDACGKLCPVREGGHECGCLHVLVRLVMEQLVNRLDVAMFNAILRESAEEMPTDPLSDPISDPKVVPIPAGKASFGAGVELKNSIGNWSRWLTDLFGIEDDSTDHSDIIGDDKRLKPFKAFRLLHALSDLMMLPFGMLADASTRKEVCPIFGPTIIKRVLSSFVPDEFCPDSIPQNIIDALDTEEVSDVSGDLLTSFPCTASPTKYSPPPAALLTCMGEVGSQVLRSSRLSSLKKSYTSDDELDELDSPFTSIIHDSLQGSALAKLGLIPKEKGGRNVVRYKLLREIWKDDE